MELIIVSDSHGLTEELTIIKERHTNVKTFIHCGDSELEATSPYLSGYKTVRGNCDYDSRLPLEIVLEEEQERIFITHGHLNRVKSSLMGLRYKAAEMNATICCFGHSHLLGVEKIGETLFINPGSIRLPRGRKEKTYIHLQKIEENYNITIYTLEGTIYQQINL